MSKVLQILKLISIIVSILGFMVSIVLTVNLAIQVFGTSGSGKIWVLLGATVGIVWNLAEMGFFIRYAVHGDVKAFIFGCVFGIVSISASVGALQMSLERGAIQSIEFQKQLSEIESLESQIKDLQSTAKDQKSINHITRSALTLASATPLFERLKNAQNNLSELKDKGAGINAALYRAYAQILGIDNVSNVAIFLNLLFSLLIEFCFVQYTLYQVYESKELEELNIGDSDYVKQPKKAGIFSIFRKTGTENKNTIGFELPIKSNSIVSGNVSEGVSGTFQKTVKNVSDFGNLNRKKDVSETVSKYKSGNGKGSEIIVNVNGSGNGGKNISIDELKRIAKRYKNKGKTDDFILFVWDNWNGLSKQQKSYGNVSRLTGRVLPGKKNTVSKTYCWRVIQRERNGDNMVQM